MAQLGLSASKRRFHRQTFEIKNNGRSVYRHTLLINPEEMDIQEPHRATVTPTLGGAYLSLFGQGLHNVTISGKTGFHARRNTEGVMTDGYQEIKNLRKRIYRDFINGTSSQYEMFWYNWEDEEYYKVIPLDMRIQRSVSSPHMYRYTLQLTTLQELGAQTKPSVQNLLSSVNALGAGQSISTATSRISEVLRMFLSRTGG